MLHKRGKGFLADVMLDTFGIGMSGGGRNAEGLEEFDNDFRAAAGFLRKFAACVG